MDRYIYLVLFYANNSIIWWCNKSFYTWDWCRPKPCTKYSFFFIARKKERILDKKEKQRRLNTDTKIQPKTRELAIAQTARVLPLFH